MICSECGTDAHESAKFCIECGNAFMRNCVSCGYSLPSHAKFCAECGTKVEASQADPVSSSKTEEKKPNKPAATASAVSPGPFDFQDMERLDDAERRQLTVLFCDLVGSTELAVELDPEDMRDILAAYRTVCGEAMAKYGSTIIQHSGDGALIIFGYPVAHENATESAVLAAMDILAAFKDAKSPLAKFDAQLNARIAINTGQVVVGRDGAAKAGEEISVIGDVPNLAARLQNLAEPGQIIVSQSTYRLTKHRFSYRDMGLQNLKGFSSPVHCYEAGVSIAGSEGITSGEARYLTSVIGRKAELSLLQERWKNSVSGDGQVVLLSGEAGVGKSRLIHAFNDSITETDVNLVRFHSSSFHTHSTLYPIISELRHRFGLNEEVDEVEKFNRIKSGLAREHQQYLPVLAKLLNVSLPEELGFPAVAPEAMKQQSLEAIVSIYSAMASDKPLLLEFEDIHWCDPTSLELIDQLIGAVGSKPWYFILVFRPDYKPPFRNFAYLTSLTLNRFSKAEIRDLIDQIAGGKKLPQSLNDQIVERADGIPLYAEEITRMVLESGWVKEVDGAYVMSSSYIPLAIPDSLQGSLMARLDRFPSAKEVAQIAATIGRRFSAELLALVSGHSGNRLLAVLDQLLDAELIYEQGVGSDKNYEFKHALVQDAAYQSLLKSSRQKCHLRIADVIELHFSDICANEPEVLARHFHAGANWAKAFEYSFNAGKKALANFANLEAITHLGHALESLRKTPQSKQRDALEFEVLVSLAVPQATALGYSHEDVNRSYTRAMELAKTQDDSSAILPVIYGLVRFHLLGARYDEAQKFAISLLELATDVKNKPMTIASHRSIGSTHFYSGRPLEAIAELKEVIEADLTKEEREEVLRYDVVDLNVAALSYAAWSHWQIGTVDTARELAEKAIKSATEIEHPFSIAFANAFASWTYAFCGDYERCRTLADNTHAISTQYSFQFWIGWADVMRAWAHAKIEEKYTAGVAEIAKGIEIWKETRSRLGLSYFLFLQADLNFSNGLFSEAQEILDEADAFVAETGENFWNPELKRLRGEISLAIGQGKAPKGNGDAKAIDPISEALQEAQKMGATSLALRAATSLQAFNEDKKSSKTDDQILADILGELDQGADTADIVAAKSLLNGKKTRAKDAKT